jgi:hypothetical protein
VGAARAPLLCRGPAMFVDPLLLSNSFGHESESDSDESMSFLNNIQPVKVHI